MSSILKRSISSTRLGDLLVQAGILTQMQLSEAMRSAQGKRMQIGQVLVMNGLISPRDLQSALEAQSMLRDKSVELTEALRCLKIAYKVGAPFKDILYEYASPKRTQSSKLGELLVESGLVSYEVLARAVEQSNITGLPLGRMLVLHQTISNETLNLVLDLQVRVRDEMSTREEAIAALRAQAGLSPIVGGSAAASETEKPKAPSRKKGLRLGELMVMAGVLTETDVMNALEWGLVNQQTIGKVLISQMLVSQGILDAALELQKLVDKGELTPTRASECLARVHAGGATLEEAVKDVREEQQASASLSFESLLTLANVLSEEELDDAFDTSTKSAAVIGKFLVLTGHLDVPTLQATLRCYQLVGKGLIAQDDAVVTLDYCLHQSPDGPIKFDDALKQLGWTKENGLRLTGEKGEDKAAVAAQASALANVDDVVANVAGAIALESASITAAPILDAGSAQGAAVVPSDTAASASANAAAAANDSAKVGTAGAAGQDKDASKSDSAAAWAAAAAAAATANAITADATTGNAAATTGATTGNAETSSAADSASTAASDSSAATGESDSADKPRKHTTTIQPSDARATRLAPLLKNEGEGGGDLMKGFDPSSDPPSALHRVFERLAHSYFRQGNFPQAQVIYERVLVHRLNQFGPKDVALIGDLTNLAGTLLAQDKYEQAEPFVRRAISITEHNKKDDPLKLAELLNILSNLYMKQDRLDEAEPLIRRCYEIRKSKLLQDHPDQAQTLSDYAKLLRKMHRDAEAEEMYKQSLAIMARIEDAALVAHGEDGDVQEEHKDLA
ncbi:MAG: tetratricopeptide repeat protein [Candidatus Obscuribacter sp.]|nr:tetratricopeptide repeat protein [Candidatus Obscuribacter sp.]